MFGIEPLSGELDGFLVARDGGQAPLQLGAKQKGHGAEPIELSGHRRPRQLRQGLDLGIRRDVHLAGERGSCRRHALLVTGPLAIQLGQEQLGAKDVLLGPAGFQSLSRDRSKILEDLAILGEDLVGLHGREQVAVGPLDGCDRIELCGCQLCQCDLHVSLGDRAPQFEGAEPGELLGQREVVGIVTHQGILRCDAGDGKHDVRCDRVVERGYLRQSMLERLGRCDRRLGPFGFRRGHAR